MEKCKWRMVKCGICKEKTLPAISLVEHQNIDCKNRKIKCDCGLEIL